MFLKSMAGCQPIDVSSKWATSYVTYQKRFGSTQQIYDRFRTGNLYLPGR